MTTIAEGASAQITVEAGKGLTVTTQGRAAVDRLGGISGAGFTTDPIVAGSRYYAPLETDFHVNIRAVEDGCDYVSGYPQVQGANVTFKRGDSGNITGMIDPDTGDIVQLGAGEDTSTWGNLPGKPAVIAAGDTKADARNAIGAGTSNLTLGTTASTALAGNYKPAWGNVTGKPSFGTAAQADTGDFATSAQGAKADSAVQPGDLSPYAKTADLALADASVAANVATGGTVDDVVAALVAAGLMASA